MLLAVNTFDSAPGSTSTRFATGSRRVRGTRSWSADARGRGSGKHATLGADRAGAGDPIGRAAAAAHTHERRSGPAHRRRPSERAWGRNHRSWRDVACGRSSGEVERVVGHPWRPFPTELRTRTARGGSPRRVLAVAVEVLCEGLSAGKSNPGRCRPGWIEPTPGGDLGRPKHPRLRRR